MDGNQTSYCTVLDKKSQTKFVCYTHRKSGIFSISLTDAADVWSTDFTEDTLSQFRQRFALKSTEDYVLKLRSACGTGNVSVVVQDTGAELHVGSSPGDLSVTLPRLEGPQAKEQLRELLFRMADGLTQSDSRVGSPCVSPVKNQQWRPTEFQPRRQQKAGPSVTVKKRLPGDSLINPGTKKKRQATGVAFDDPEDE
ncbi:protein PAXX [Centroberyx affinis]|uniref:protein PAXX n=1 Tax=Centroberyx affinis TaxID=166261 RepID=UPI003A5C58D7